MAATDPDACQWRLPDDNFGHLLRVAFEFIVANPGSSRSLDPLEPILAGLYVGYDQARAERVGWMGFELVDFLDSHGSQVAPDVWHFCDDLRELIFEPNPYITNVGEMLVWLREIVGPQGGRG